MKKILYIDMDGVIADFNQGVIQLQEEKYSHKTFLSWDQTADFICDKHPNLFENLPPIEGAIATVEKLFEIYDVYFLSTPVWRNPKSYQGKRIWIEKHFGEKSKKRLILTHRKDLQIGDYLVDDRLHNGAGAFKGFHIHFGTNFFPDWEVTLKYLESVK